MTIFKNKIFLRAGNESSITGTTNTFGSNRKAGKLFSW